MKIRKGDDVVVTTGDDKGSTVRQVISVDREKNLVTLQGVNRAFKHVKRGHPRSPQGGRLQIELPVSASNVMYFCPSCNKASRLGFRPTADGGKERYCKACNASAGQVSPPKKRATSA